jgi:ABC-type transport system involved in cytochrome c biogenesis ATPase subunit
MLINLTNHPYANWPGEQQHEAQRLYQQIVDVPFPAIEPEWDRQDVINLAELYVTKCIDILKNSPSSAIHVMGEMTFTHAFVIKAKEKGITCIAATTKRIVTQEAQNTKTAVFQFVRFREY